MTEYDYSPGAHQRYLATLNRIANWVDQTEQNRPQFEHPFQPAGPSTRPGPMSYDSHRRLSKRSPPASPTHQYPPQMPQMQQPRQLFIHPPAPEESDSSDDYGDGPGPMPLPSPGMMHHPQQPAFHPMGQPMLTPPPMMMPPTYMTAPHKSSHRHRSSHSHSRSRSQQSPVYYSMAPPVSPGYQYPFPQMMGGGHPGYIMMQPQHHHSGRQMPLMYLS